MKIEVLVKTSARHAKLEQLSATRFAIAVKAKPQDGQANLELIRTLATFFSVPQSAVTLLHGHHSKRKLFGIETKRG